MKMVDRAGQQLGNYRLIRLLGQGGFADVYLGEHIHLKTRAAIKILHTKLSETDIAQFLKEAQTIAQLEHPNIIQVYDFAIAEGIPYLVMHYASEGTLRQRHPKGERLPPEQIVQYVKPIADALQYAHNEKLIHRDVKPENMLLGRGDKVLLSDFGLAFIMQSSHYQSTLSAAGTVSYMAPEQIQGKPRPASDQYALGITVYEWLCGSRPFQGSFTEIATQHVLAPPPPLHEKLNNISPTLEKVVIKALAKDPYQRFGTVQEFSSAFEEASLNPLSSSPTIYLSQSLPQSSVAVPMPAPITISQPPLTYNPETNSSIPGESLKPAFSPTQTGNPYIGYDYGTPEKMQEPRGAIAQSNEPRRPERRMSRRTVLISIAAITLFIVLFATGWILGQFPSGSGGQLTLTGSIVSATGNTVVISVNGQQDTITNVPANIIQQLSSQIGKVYSFQVTANGDGTFSIVRGSNLTLDNTEGTPESAHTPTIQHTPITVEQGSISFFGNIIASSNNSVTVSMPDGSQLAMAISSSTDLSDFNNAVPGPGTNVHVIANTNPDGSFTAGKIGSVARTDTTNLVTFTGVTTAAVGSDNVIHFTVGSRSYSFTITSGADLADFNNNAQAIASGILVTVAVQYNSATNTLVRQVRNG